MGASGRLGARCGSARCQTARVPGTVLLCALTASVAGGQKAVRCFDGIYTAVRCCKRDRTEDPTCWATGYTFEMCCTEGHLIMSDEVRHAAGALRGPEQSPGLAGLRQCLDGGGTFTFSDFFAQDHPRSTPMPPLRTDHLQRRLGRVHRPGRCTGRPGPRPPHEVAAEMYQRLRDSGAALTGRVVNFGAGTASDPAWAIAIAYNLSGVFVDPGGRPVGDGQARKPGRARFLTTAAQPGNMCAILRRGGITCFEDGAPWPLVDFAKVDTDGCDCQLASALVRAARPLILWIEVNMAFPPPLRYSRVCHPDWWPQWLRWSKGGVSLSFYGCSLAEAVAQFGLLGYSLYGLADSQDAIFVHRSVADLLGGADEDELACYRSVYREAMLMVPGVVVDDWMSSSPEEAVLRAWCNLTLHQHHAGISHLPFTLSTM